METINQLWQKRDELMNQLPHSMPELQSTIMTILAHENGHKAHASGSPNDSHVSRITKLNSTFLGRMIKF